MQGIDEWSAWRGRRAHGTDLIAAAPVRALGATLDTGAGAAEGAAIMPLAHWLFFQPCVAQSDIGQDGHPALGGFLPPLPLPRRMWAGGRLAFLAPLRIGQRALRTSTIADIAVKDGRSGPLAFVTVRHEIGCDGVELLVEEQDIVYRAAATPGAIGAVAPRARTDEQFAREVTPDPVLLFRYSALTFNGHRIHYDRDYARGVEGYPGLVVHGPLIATLLLDLLRRELPSTHLTHFSFRAVGPLFDGSPFALCGRVEPDGKRVALWARNAGGGLAMDAVATLA